MTKKIKERLKDIADYILPVYTFDEKKYVPLESAMYMKEKAKKILKELK